MMPSESVWAERRLSNSSDGSAGSSQSKATSDSADFLTTRPHTAAVLPGKPAANPLQFIKVGPAELGSRAREQLRRAELAKRTEPAKVERQEDWQSNLDNWKSSRRKRVEHIIERCVEVRRMEQEPTQPRAKAKTFNEMLEERAGRRRRNPLALYTDDESHDLSDLGIGTSSTKSSLSEDCDAHSLASDGMDLDKNHHDADNIFNGDNKLSTNDYDTCTTNTISSPEPEEYTYERAIEGYKSRIISQTNSSIVNTVVNKNEKEVSSFNGDINRIRTSISNKIEEKVSSFQKERNNDVQTVNLKKDLPKVDIHKRREHFEKENSQEAMFVKPKMPEISNKKSIKDRLSSLEKYNDNTKIQKSINDISKLPNEVKPLKDRLSSLEKNKSLSCVEIDKSKKISNSDFHSSKSVKERLSSLNSQKSEEDLKTAQTEIQQVSLSLKERLSSLDAAKNKETTKASTIDVNKVTNGTNDDNRDILGDTSPKSSLSDQMQSFCRSLDSLDINEQSSPSSFERVQSLEDFDCLEIPSNTVPSDIETEDSGIHTARDSCAPSDDIADLTQVASPISEPTVEASEYESYNEDGLCGYDKLEDNVEKCTHISQNIVGETIVEEVEEQDLSKAEDTDSASNYLQALSHPEECSFTEELTELQIDKEDDTLKSLENQDNSVLDALELAFKELDSEDSSGDINEETKDMPPKKEIDYPSEIMKPKNNNHVSLKQQEHKISVAPLYENVDILCQNDDIVNFALDMPSQVLEPPKEKPPPPPIEENNDELLGLGNFKHTSSARRIKKEIRNKRTSFLGIEGQIDDSYLDPDLALPPRPDLTTFLQKETEIEKLLYRKTLSNDTEAKLRDSRDSGVDVDRGMGSDWYRGHSSSDVSNEHSRENSEPFVHTSASCEKYLNTENRLQQDFNSKLTSKLTDLSTDFSSNDENKIDTLDKKLEEQQESATNADFPDGLTDDGHTKEVLRYERELLQLEQEELRRQRENLVRDQNRIQQNSQDVTKQNVLENSENENYRHSMPNLLIYENCRPVEQVKEKPTPSSYIKRKPFVSEEHIQSHFGVEESRKVLFHGGVKVNEAVRKPLQSVRPVQPILAPKPKSRESIEREITMRSSRIPSAGEYVNVEEAKSQRPAPATHHPMSRHTLQALSAAPTPKLIAGAEWMRARPRPAPPSYTQHWLVHEAEQRRLEEQSVKRHSYHQPVTSHAVRTPSHSANSPGAAAQRSSRGEDKMLSVSGKRKCSHCGEELGRGAAMVIESLSLCYHVWCFACAACGQRLGDGRAGADVRVRRGRLHCRHCYSADDGSRYSRV